MMESGRSGVTVKKSDLLTKLKHNRSAHRALFVAAYEGFKTAAIKELQGMLSDAMGNRDVRLHLALEVPQDHTKDYDRAITMLEMAVKDEIFIDDREFAQYVMDDWGWKEQFVGTSSRYTK